MNYLITVASLASRDGSALAAIEIAEELRRRGASVSLTSMKIGSWVTSHTSVTTCSLGDAETLAKFAPDRVVLLHWPNYFALQTAGIEAASVFGFLGTVPPLENPPPLAPEMTVPWFGISESVVTNVESLPLWADQPHALVRNWTAWSPGEARVASPLRSLAVVSNRMPDEREAQLRRVASNQGIVLTRFGLPHNSVEIKAETLAPFDAVVAIGRSVLDAMQLGRPALVYDLYGSDGWVRPNNVDDLAAESFSAKRRSHIATDEELAEWLASPPSLDDVVTLQQWVNSRATVNSAVDTIERLFESSSVTNPSWGRFGESVVDAWRDQVRLERALAVREQQLANLTVERDRAVATLHALSGVLERVHPRVLRRCLKTCARWLIQRSA